MSQAPFWPVATDAFIADTVHLSAEETGAYLMLLMCLWRSNGKPIPLDHKKLPRMARVRPNRWPAIWDNLEEFFHIENAMVTQKRLRKDWVTVQENITRKRESGSLGGKAKSLKTKKPPLANGTFLPELCCSNHNHNQKEKEKNPPKKLGAVSDFEENLKTKAVGQEVLEECLRITSLPTHRPRDNQKWIGIVNGWIEAGAIPEKHIYPVLRRILQKTKITISSLGFFTNEILAEVDRLTPLEKDQAAWQARVEGYRDRQYWNGFWGMEPGHTECMAPPHILEQCGFQAFKSITPAN